MRSIALIFLLLAVALPVRAESTLDVQDAWIRHMTGDRPMAGYFVMSNKGGGERRLVGASSTAFGAAQIHESVEKEGTMSMRPVESVDVPAGGSIEFRPGGHHLMLMKRQEDIEVGDEVTIVLELADGGTRAVVFTVKPVWQE